MKKSRIVFLVFVCIIVTALLNAFILFNQEAVFNILGHLLEKPIVAFGEAMEKERLGYIERGEPVPGRDTMTIWNKKYDICKYYENDEKLGALAIHEKDFNKDIIDRIKDFEKRGKKLYIYSYDGYAVIDKENVCRVFITVPEEDFTKGYTEDEYGNRIRFYPTKVEHEKIIYLSSFDEFSEKEQKILKYLKTR